MQKSARFNVPSPGAPPTTISATTSDETSVFDMYPAHNLPTTYTYNSTNQATRQLSPDGGTVRYWYDMLSRLVVSENAQQYTANNYSYTLYDAIGRISEVGQKNYTGTSIGTPGFLSSSTITAFNAAGTNSQITDTYYDAPVPTVSGNANGIATLPGQGNLRKRVAASTYTETQGSPALRATYYNYDIEGNVKTLWQQVDGLYVNSSNTGLKRIDYEYDLVSGKVNMVRYQDNLADRFYYQYNYDADNRITDAMSGTNDITDTLTGSSLTANNQRLDAHYAYYLHGPLARMELGDVNAKVQGVDYAYTLQGWLKGVNSAAVQSSRDMGHDSIPVARDSYGYALYYYGNGSSVNDYTPVNSSVTAPFSTLFPGLSTFSSLYNGNIAAVTMNIPKLTDPWHLYTYKYDQLNRIRASSVYKVSSTATPVSDYHETFNYDENGNITVDSRYAGAATIMDSLTYRYNTSGGIQASNQLNRINDAVTTHTWPYGFDNQAVNNYTYDYNGSMTADVRDTISNVNWTVYGKLLNLTNSKGLISYTYNPNGQRVSETANGITTWYIRDAQGNQLAVYDNTHSVTNWWEQDLYGSSRLGMWQPNIRVGTDSVIAKWDTIGKKAYELDNHLGNVLATITDKRLQTASGSSIGYFGADIATAQEYYAFGGLMPGRMFTQVNNYRFGFNSKENDNAAKGVGNQIDYGMRIYDPRIGRFPSVDALFIKYPQLSSYQFANNSPIEYVDLDGAERYNYNILFDKGGKAYLQKAAREDIIDHSIKLTSTFPFITILPILNKRQEFVIHGPVIRYFDVRGTDIFYTDEDEETFNTLVEAKQYVKKNNGIAFNEFNFSHQLAQGVDYMAENALAGEWFGATSAYSPTGPITEPEPEPMPGQQEQANLSKGVTVTNTGEKISIYRGGNNLELKSGEYRITPNGKYPARGLSLDLSAENAATRGQGGAYRIISIPKELEIIHTPSQSNPGHYDIIPRDPQNTSTERFQELLNEVKVEPVKSNTPN